MRMLPGLTKTLAIDAEGKILADAMETYPLHHPKPLWSEQDPEEIIPMKRLVGTMATADVTARLYDDGSWEVDTPACANDRGAAAVFSQLFRGDGKGGSAATRRKARQLRLAAEAFGGLVLMAEPPESDSGIAG